MPAATGVEPEVGAESTAMEETAIEPTDGFAPVAEAGGQPKGQKRTVRPAFFPPSLLPACVPEPACAWRRSGIGRGA